MIQTKSTGSYFGLKYSKYIICVNSPLLVYLLHVVRSASGISFRHCVEIACALPQKEEKEVRQGHVWTLWKLQQRILVVLHQKLSFA